MDSQGLGNHRGIDLSCNPQEDSATFGGSPGIPLMGSPSKSCDQPREKGKIDLVTATSWALEQGRQLELANVVKVPRIGWSEREVRQPIRRAVPEQGSYVVDVKPEFEEEYTYALSLAEGLEAQVIPLLTAGKPEEEHSRHGS